MDDMLDILADMPQPSRMPTGKATPKQVENTFQMNLRATPHNHSLRLEYVDWLIKRKRLTEAQWLQSATVSTLESILDAIVRGDWKTPITAPFTVIVDTREQMPFTFKQGLYTPARTARVR